MKIKTSKLETATVEFSIGELKEYFNTRLMDFNLEGYSIVSIIDKTKSHFEQGADPHDGFYEDYFDGIKIQLEKK